MCGNNSIFNNSIRETKAKKKKKIDLHSVATSKCLSVHLRQVISKRGDDMLLQSR